MGPRGRTRSSSDAVDAVCAETADVEKNDGGKHHVNTIIRCCCCCLDFFFFSTKLTEIARFSVVVPTARRRDAHWRRSGHLYREIIVICPRTTSRRHRRLWVSTVDAPNRVRSSRTGRKKKINASARRHVKTTSHRRVEEMRGYYPDKFVSVLLLNCFYFFAHNPILPWLHFFEL